MVSAAMGGVRVLLDLWPNSREPSIYGVGQQQSLCVVSVVEDELALLRISKDLEVTRVYMELKAGEYVESPSTKVMGVFCDICEFLFESRYHLKKHSNKQHNKSEVVLCRCKKAFFSVYEKREHMKNCMFKCPNCDFTSVKERDMKSHQNRKHKYDVSSC